MKIVQKENKILRQIAKEIPIKEIPSQKIKNIIDRMTKVLQKSNDGVALAAPQIGESVRIFIVAGNYAHRPVGSVPPTLRVGNMVFINPIIKKISKNKLVVQEGCLSVEGLYGIIKRAEKLTIEAFNENGKKFMRGVSGLLAQIIQHEMDHLNGILFIDKAMHLEKVKKHE